MESSSHALHENLNKVIDYQTHHRLRESQGRKRSEDLNERVFLWAVGETISIVVMGRHCRETWEKLIDWKLIVCFISFSAISLVFVLKSLFSEKKPSQMMFR